MKPLAPPRPGVLPYYTPDRAHREQLERQGITVLYCGECHEQRPFCACRRELEAALERRFGR